MHILAVDLGTSNSVGVVWDGREYKAIDCEGSHLLPSVVAYNSNGTIKSVGRAALNHYWVNQNVVRFAKRIIGYDFNSPEVKQYMDNCGCEVGRGIDGKAAFLIPAFQNRSLTPTVVSSHIIQTIANYARKQFNSQMDGLVVSVPAFFDQVQIDETRKAAEMAQVCEKRNIKIVSEPVAAALEYGVVSQKNATIMVIDFGGGTADTCIMRIDKTTFKVLGKNGDRCLGGDDVTNAFITFVERKFEELNDGEKLIPYSPHSVCWRGKRECLKSRVEEAKCQFADAGLRSVSIRVDDIHDQYMKREIDEEEDDDDEEEDMIIERREFEQCIDSLMRRVIQVTRETLKIAGLTKNDIDNVIMVGGSSRLLLLQQMVRDEYGEKVMMVSNPDECVAFGACRASKYPLEAANIHFLDVVPHFYGCVKCSETSSQDEFMTLIPRNTPFPTTEVFERTLYLVHLSNGTAYPEASLDVWVSTDGTMRTAKQKNTLVVTNANTTSGNAVTVHFSIDDSGMIHAMITQCIGENPLVPDTIMCRMQPQNSNSGLCSTNTPQVSSLINKHATSLVFVQQTHYKSRLCSTNTPQVSSPVEQRRRPEPGGQREHPVRVLVQLHQQIHRLLLVLLAQRLSLLPLQQQVRVPVAHLRVVEHFLARKAVQRNGLLLLREELQRLQVPVHHSTHPHPQTLACHRLILLQQNRRDRTQRVAAHHVLVNPDPAVIRQLQRILQRRAALLHLLLEQVEGTRVVQRLTHRRLVRVGDLELGLHFLGQVVHALA